MDLLTASLLLLVLLIGAALGYLLGSARARSSLSVDLAEARTAQRLLTERTSALEADARLATEVTAAVGPLSAGVKALHQSVGEQDRARLAQLARLDEQIRHLSQRSAELQRSTQDLFGALTSTTARGAWGEVQLKRIVEHAGMLPHVDFDTQVSVRGSEPEQRGARPDLIVRLPHGGTVVIDAKTPLSSRLQAAAQSTDDGADHAAALRRHIDQLASKEYWALFDSAPEFVVCFIPTDGLLSAAAAQDPQLVDRALSKNVVLASPSTLLVLLKTVALNWRHYEISASAKEVMRLGRELYERTGTLGERLSRLGGSLDKAVAEYNGFIGSFESRFLVTARKFPATGVVHEELPAISRTDAQTRGMSASELL